MLVTKGGADNVRRPATISVTETGVGKVDSGVCVIVLGIVVCVPWNVPGVPLIDVVAVPWVKKVVVIGDTLVGAQETWLGGRVRATAGHDKVDFTVVADVGETKDDCGGGFLGVGEELSGTARGPEVTNTLGRVAEWPDGL